MEQQEYIEGAAEHGRRHLRVRLDLNELEGVAGQAEEKMRIRVYMRIRVWTHTVPLTVCGPL